jgi:hypothetical protein
LIIIINNKYPEMASSREKVFCRAVKVAITILKLTLEEFLKTCQKKVSKDSCMQHYYSPIYASHVTLQAGYV